MRSIAVVAILGLALLGAAPASADDDVTTMTGSSSWSDAQGGYLWSSECELVAAAQGSATGGNVTFTGTIAGTAVAFKPSTNELASVDLHCQVRVNDSVVVAGGNGATNGVDSDGGQVTFSANDTDLVEVCITLPGISSQAHCEAANRATAPPSATDSLLEDTLKIVNDALCPVLKSLSPIVVGSVFALEPDGDVVVLGNRVYDCPPYGV